MYIVSDILENKEFTKIKNCRHHGLNRLDHSIRVSYYSYLVCKRLKLNAVETARAGLLHDFFTENDLSQKKQRFSMFFHPYASLKNAKTYFRLTDREEDIIISHMFPSLPHKVPKYIDFVAEFPMNAAGKILKYKMREDAAKKYGTGKK